MRKSEEMVAKVVELQRQLSNIQSDINDKNAPDYTVKKRFFSFEDIVGESDAIRASINQAKNAARSDSPVFLYGETGTGKEMFAQSIHNASARKNNPLISINCAAIPENLLEGIIFGTVKGVYTGSTNRKGLFEEADGGTLFLDEINSMPIHLQSKLLRALEEMRIMRLGGKDEIPVNVRIISSCNISPEMAVSQNRIRSDLYFRLAVIEIEIPPLRVRKDDIRILLELFIRKFNAKTGKNLCDISPEIVRRLKQYDWPGNIRQLKHWIESAVTMIPEDDTILTEKYAPHFYNFIFPSENDMSVNLNENRIKKSKGEVFEEIRDQEITKIIQMLKQHGGNITKTAEELGISRQGLQYRMKKLGIK
jgi:arginine utilization regulatory protein